MGLGGEPRGEEMSGCPLYLTTVKHYTDKGIEKKTSNLAETSTVDKLLIFRAP